MSYNPSPPPGFATPENRPRRRGGLLKELVIVAIAALVLSVVVKTFFFKAFVIPSPSMENTLQITDRVFVNLLVPGPFGLERGDVVVFQDEQSWLQDAPATAPPGPIADALTFLGLRPDDSTQHLVKRIIGMPGDTVECEGNGAKIKVNGVEITEPYLYPSNEPSVDAFKAVVPEGKIWVMGDHRAASADSRAHFDKQGGFVDVDAVEGRADVIAWPLNRIGGVETPEGAFDGVQDRVAAPYDSSVQEPASSEVTSE